MSSFKTIVPVDLDKIQALLPNGSTVERFEWNARTQTLEMFWHNGKCLTKYTFATEWPMDLLEAQEMPKGVEEWQPEESRPTIEKASMAVGNQIAKQLDRQARNGVKPEPPVEGIISRLVKGMTKPKPNCPLATPTQTPPSQENHLTRMMKSAKTRSDVRVRTGKTAHRGVPRKASTSVDTTAGSTAPAVDGSGSAANARLPEQQHGAKVSDSD